MDVYLESKLSSEMQEDTPIFGTDLQVSCMQLQENEFLLHYPLLTSQMDFFESKQTKGPAFRVWAFKLRALGNEADLSGMNIEDLYIMRYLKGRCDEKLSEKFLKEPKPLLKFFDRIAHQHEVAASVVKTMTTSQTEARLARMVGQRHQRRVPTTKELMGQKKFIRCGMPGHTANVCQHKETRCHGCKGKGHLKRVCQNGMQNESQKQSRARAVKEEEVEVGQEAPHEYTSDENHGKETEDQDNRLTIRHIASEMTTHSMTVEINKTFKMQACADTGTTQTIISQDMCLRHGLQIYQVKERLFAGNGERMACKGKTPLKIEYQGITTAELVSSVMKNDILISLEDLIMMRV